AESASLPPLRVFPHIPIRYPQLALWAVFFRRPAACRAATFGKGPRQELSSKPSAATRHGRVGYGPRKVHRAKHKVFGNGHEVSLSDMRLRATTRSNSLTRFF